MAVSTTARIALARLGTVIIIVTDHYISAGTPLPRCVLPLWHPPVTSLEEARALAPPSANIQCISAGGHAYTCSHTGGQHGCYHTIIVPDRSGSMSDRSVRPGNPLVQTLLRQFPGLDCMAGVVCEASLAYMHMRRSNNPQDIVSYITFDTQAEVVFQQQSIAGYGAVEVLLQSVMEKVREHTEGGC